MRYLFPFLLVLTGCTPAVWEALGLDQSVANRPTLEVVAKGGPYCPGGLDVNVQVGEVLLDFPVLSGELGEARKQVLESVKAGTEFTVEATCYAKGEGRLRERRGYLPYGERYVLLITAEEPLDERDEHYAFRQGPFFLDRPPPWIVLK